jgi:hypothetical protein
VGGERLLVIINPALMAKIFPSRFFLVPWSGVGSKPTDEFYDLFKLEKLNSAPVSIAGGFMNVDAAVVRSTNPEGRKYLWIQRMEQDMPAFRYVELKSPDQDALTDSELERLFAERTSDRLALIDFAPAGREYLKAIGDLTVIGAYIFALEQQRARQICDRLMKSDLLTRSDVNLGECTFQKPKYLTNRNRGLFGQFKKQHPEIALQITESVGEP